MSDIQKNVTKTVVVPLGVGPSRAAFETAIAGLSRSAFRIWNYLIWAPPGAEVDVSPSAIQTRYPDISIRSYYLAMAELYEKRFLILDGRNGKTTLRAVWPDDETATRVATVLEPEKPKTEVGPKIKKRKIQISTILLMILLPLNLVVLILAILGI